MISFESDYINGCHPKILEKIIETNNENLSGYGSDIYTLQAKEKIKKFCGINSDIYFLVGGTQTNKIVISTMLNRFEGIIAANTGHISIHEAGAIELTGHKVIELQSKDGKLSANEIDSYIKDFYNDGNHAHMVYPGMVYISYPTEYGTLYSKEELTNISNVCRKHKIPLYIDGARLGYGLMSNTDITIKDIAVMCDVFYIGGTKIGALCGEAVVFTKNNTPKNFITLLKQQGALLAKGRLLGIQFDTLFTDDLYFKISKHAIDMANEMKKIFQEKNYHFYLETPTNQQFIILENTQLINLKEKVLFNYWEKYDDNHTVVRFATSWSTQYDDIEKLREVL